MSKREKRRIHISDNVKAALLRWWIMGMCYFMIGFGTQLGMPDDPLDLIFALGVGTGIVTIVVYNPIAYNAFTIVRSGEVVNQVRKKRQGAAKALQNLGEIGVSMLVVILIYLTYQNVNQLLVQALEKPEGTVIIGGEPFGFATLYIIFYSALVGLYWKIRALRRQAKAEKEKNEEDHEIGA